MLVDPLPTMFSLSSLPVDVLIVVLESCRVDELTALSLTCHALYSLVTEYGWSSYLRANPRPSCSLSKARQLWLPAVRAQYDVMVDSAWTYPHFVARPLSRMWAGKLQPVMAISPHRLIVGAGSSLYSYGFGAAKGSASSPPIVFEGVVSLLDGPEHARNITAISFILDDGATAILDVAFQDGAIERTRLTNTRHIAGGAPVLSCTRNKGAHMPDNDFVESISVNAGSVLALSTNGHARLSSNHTDFSGAATTHALINLQSRSWVAHLCMEASTPYAAFGTASTTPLNIYTIADGGALAPRPTAILHTKRGADLPPDMLPSSAVYGLARGPLNSPWGSSPQILVSGWFDGQVRCYDLRSSARAAPNGAPGGAPHLRPVLSLVDRWSYEPIYSVACGGGSAAHIAAGTARHSVVSFWDVRAPATSWSVHAPGNDPSPVYSVVLESSRFFGVTQSRPFVYDFGPGVSLDTYPPLPQVRGIDNLKQKKGSNRATYHVLRYQHNGSGLCNEPPADGHKVNRGLS